VCAGEGFAVAEDGNGGMGRVRFRASRGECDDDDWVAHTGSVWGGPNSPFTTAHKARTS
jgi:hypothetical protein